MSLIESMPTNQKDASIVLSCIDQVNTKVNILDTKVDNLDNETFVSDVNNILITATSSTTNNADNFVVSLGTNNDISNDTNLLLGCDSAITNATNCVNLGIYSDILGSVNNLAGNIINIGHSTDVVNPVDANPQTNIINIGNSNDLYNKSNIITIGHDLGHGGQIGDVVIISANMLDNTNAVTPVDGSIILQSSASTIVGHGGQPSQQPRFSIFGNTLLNPVNDTNNPVDGNTTFAIANIHGYIRMKYKNMPIKIPFILDSEGVPNAGPATNITEF